MSSAGVDLRMERGGPSSLASFTDLPLDLLQPVIERLTQRKDLWNCSLVNRDFNTIATPLLYRNLGVVRNKKTHHLVHHPSDTILQRPELAQHVHHITESGSIHIYHYQLTDHAIRALLMCTSLKSFTWTDDSDGAFILFRFLEAIKRLPRPLEAITVRSFTDIGNDTYNALISLSGLQRVAWFCMDGPPRVLQGWPDLLGPTLTHLEFGRCAGVPPSVLVSVLSQLPRLESLLLKGAPAFAVANILACLPNLRQLDTEYIPSLSTRSYRRSVGNSQDESRPSLVSLTIRTSSLEFEGPRMLWSWILDTISVPHPSLEVFRLHTFINIMNHLEVPRVFIMKLAQTHGSTLKQFAVRGAQLTLNDVECLCSLFPQLEFIESSIWIESNNLDALKTAITKGKNLRALKLNVRSPFSTKAATESMRDLMIHSSKSKLRWISVDGFQYTGKWHLVDDVPPEANQDHPEYQVMCNNRGEPRTLKFMVSKTDNSEDGW